MATRNCACNDNFATTKALDSEIERNCAQEEPRCYNTSQQADQARFYASLISRS